MIAKRNPPIGNGDWLTGVAIGPTGARQYGLFRPYGVRFGERLPLMVMLHGCHQDATGFAESTRMKVLAARERLLVLYPQHDSVSNAQGCWNWYDTRSGRAFGEAALIKRGIDQAVVLSSADKQRVGIAGLSAGASMAAMLATRFPHWFTAVTMHSGIPPGAAHSSLSAVSAMYGRRAARPLAASPGTPGVRLPPLLVIHGTSDLLVAPSNGRAAALQRLAHAWSGGAATGKFNDQNGPDASRMAWAFTAKQFDRTA